MMTPRSLAWMRRVALGCGLMGMALVLPGCDPRQAMFFLQPFDPKIAPPCPSLKGERVVIVTRTSPSARTDYPNIDNELTTKLIKILRENVKKIDIVSSDKVRDWLRSKPSLTDPAEAARAFDADVVIALEIQEFQVQSPLDVDMYHGKSNIHIQVVKLDYPKDDNDKPLKDKEKESEVIYEGDRTTEFPTTGGIPIESGTSKADFKNKYLKLVVEELSWHFVEHEPGDNIQDTKFRD